MNFDIRPLRPRKPLLLVGFPPIVCICGSTKFAAEILEAASLLTLAGAVVVKPEILGHSLPGGQDANVTEEQKTALDELHLRKIELSDAVVVINRDGYVGESTAREIAFAEKHAKPIHWLDHVVEEDFLTGEKTEMGFLDAESSKRLTAARTAVGL